MAIKMRTNMKLDSVCCECGQIRKKVLDMFDICISGNIFTICDLCNETLFRKSLSATCYTNGRVKSKEDIAIINQRGRNRDYVKELEKQLNKNDKEPSNNKKEKEFDKELIKEMKEKASFIEGEYNE